MYRDWPFFRATIDNAVLAVAKSNRPVFRRYCELAGDDAGCREIATMIEAEWRADGRSAARSDRLPPNCSTMCPGSSARSPPATATSIR